MVSSFISDKEKMRDFRRMSKKDFLRFYSYLTEAEYDKTKRIIKRHKLNKVI